MKILFRTGLFFLLVIFVIGCKTQRLSTAAEYSKFYNSINKEYDDAVAFTQSGLNIQQREKEAKNKGKGAISEKDSLYIYVTEMSKDIKDLKAITAELKKNEKADFDKVNTSATTSVLSLVSQSVNSPSVTSTSTETEIASTPMPAPPVFPVNKIENSEKTGFKREKEEDEVKNIVRKGKFTLVNSADASLLKKYNVVIATLSKEAGTEFVKDAITKNDSDEVVFAVKNNAGKYYVILGSYDTQAEALEKRRSVIKNYTQRYSKAALMKKYGIQFSDTWIVYDEN